MKNVFSAFLVALTIATNSYSEECEKSSLQKIEVEQLIVDKNGLFYIDEVNNIFGIEAVYNIQGAFYVEMMKMEEVWRCPGCGTYWDNGTSTCSVCELTYPTTR